MKRVLEIEYALLIWDPVDVELTRGNIAKLLVDAGFTSESADNAQVVVARLTDGTYMAVDEVSSPDNSDTPFPLSEDAYDDLVGTVDSQDGLLWLILQDGSATLTYRPV